MPPGDDSAERLQGRTAERWRCARVALGREPPTLVLRGGRVFSAFTGEFLEADVALCGARIAGLGVYPEGPGLDVSGRVVLPGLVDAHFHVESSLLSPAAWAQVVVTHGTTTVMEEPHELVNVVGPRGVEFFLAAREGLPVDLRVMLPSSVPASPFEESAGRMTAADVARYAGREGVVGLGEVMDYAGVLGGGRIWEVLEAAEDLTKDGHAPGLTGRSLAAYLAAGVQTDHETSDPTRLQERMRLGMWLLAREGSASRDLDRLMPFLREYGTSRTCLCTDDRHAGTLVAEHHIDGLVARLVSAGIEAADALRAATLNPAELYGLSDRGAVAPGMRADLAVVEDPGDPHPALVLSGGRIVARDGRATQPPPRTPPLSSPPLRIHTEDLSGLVPAAPTGRHPARALRLRPGTIETVEERVEIEGDGLGRVRLPPESDLAYSAVLERHRGTGLVGAGLVAGTGLERGAVASTVAHDAHHLIVLGREAAAMEAVVRALVAAGGGLAVAGPGGAEPRLLPLPLAGLMTDRPAEEVARDLGELESAAAALGLRLDAPFMALSFLALSVIPELRLTPRGLLHVASRKIVPVLV